MRDLVQWIHARLGGIHHANSSRAADRVLAAWSGTERSIDDDGAQLLDSELGSYRLPLIEDGLLVVDAQTDRVLEIYPSAGRRAGLLAGAVGSSADPFGRVRVISNIVSNSTPHHGLSRDERLRMEELAAANRRKDEFLAMLSHELRSPLASIRYAFRLLTGPAGDTSARQRMQTLIERQLQRMTQLVDELLDVSRITNGRLHLQLERLDLRAIVSHAIETLEPDIKERTQRLSTVMPAAPVWLQADPCRLEQVFVNLLANASRYTDAGGELSVSVQTSAAHAIVRVQDTGIGIAPEALPHIFDLFKQANAAEPRSRAGLGIGLAVVRNLVQLHGGSVTATSAGSGHGSEFIVSLPIAD